MRLRFSTKAPKFAPMVMKAKTMSETSSNSLVSVLWMLCRTLTTVNDMYELAGLDPEEARKEQREMAMDGTETGITGMMSKVV